MQKETYEKPDLKKHASLKSITLVSHGKVTVARQELFIGDDE